MTSPLHNTSASLSSLVISWTILWNKSLFISASTRLRCDLILSSRCSEQAYISKPTQFHCPCYLPDSLSLTFPYSDSFSTHFILLYWHCKNRPVVSKSTHTERRERTWKYLPDSIFHLLLFQSQINWTLLQTINSEGTNVWKWAT